MTSHVELARAFRQKLAAKSSHDWCGDVDFDELEDMVAAEFEKLLPEGSVAVDRELLREALAAAKELLANQASSGSHCVVCYCNLLNMGGANHKEWCPVPRVRDALAAMDMQDEEAEDE